MHTVNDHTFGICQIYCSYTVHVWFWPNLDTMHLNQTTPQFPTHAHTHAHTYTLTHTHTHTHTHTLVHNAGSDGDVHHQHHLC